MLEILLRVLTDPQSIMPVLYPILGAVCLMVSTMFLLTYGLLNRQPSILGTAIHFILEAATMLLLRLVTGHNPWLPIDSFRIWIVYVRIIMMVNLVATFYYQIYRFRNHISYRHVSRATQDYEP